MISEIKRKRIIDDDGVVPNKAVILNNRDVIKTTKISSLSNLYFSRSVMLFTSHVYKNNQNWHGLPKERKH